MRACRAVGAPIRPFGPDRWPGLTRALVLAGLLLAELVAGYAGALTHGELGASGLVGEPSIDVDALAVGVDETSGAATLSIPVDLPPGPNGLRPELTIAYSSRGQNGLMGVGWSLPIPRVGCSARFGVPDYGACERYELDGEPLVGPDDAGSYHTFEESFARIERGHPANAWSVTSADGLVMRFGETSQARVPGPGGVAEWALSTIEDVFGNRVRFEYAPGPPGDEGVLYPDRIRYANDTREIRFVYEARPDAIRSYRGGVRRAASERLREIRVFVGARLHHRLVLRYETAESTTQSRLISLQRFGADCDPFRFPDPAPEVCSALPAAEFDYQDAARFSRDERWQDTGAPGATPEPPPWYAPARADFGTGNLFARGQTTQFADIDGDGLLDLVVDLPSRHDRPTLMETSAGDHRSTSPFVYLNDGVGGWEEPTWDGGTREIPREDPASVPDNASAQWTDRLTRLRFDIVSLRVKQVRSGMMGFTSFDDPYLDDAPLFGSCIEAGDPLPTATTIPDGGSIQLAGPQGSGYGVPPYFEATAGRNYPLRDAPPWLIPEVDWDTVAESEIRPWPHFQLVDLNADGLADLVMSTHLSGFHLSLDDCASRRLQDVSRATWISGRTTTVAFINTGEGWVRDDADDLTDGNFADTLPPFGIVAFESADLLWAELGWSHPDGPADWDERVASPCDDFGLAGFRTLKELQFDASSYDFCVTAYDLTPVFEDFDGDGHPDLLVTRTADIDALLHEYAPETIRGDPPTEFRTSPGTESVVYLQDPEATGSQPRWVRAPAYDPPIPHALVLQIPGDSAGTNTISVYGDSFGNPQTFNIDKGVRVTDLNRDGLSDMLFSPGGASRGEFDDRGGVLLNRGAVGDPVLAPRHSAWCASSAVPQVPLCANGGQEAARYTPPVSFAFFDGQWGGDWTLDADGYHVVGYDQRGFDLVDLNGDGWTDILTSGWASRVGPGVSIVDHRAFIHQPGAGSSAWIEDEDFRPPAITIFEDVPEGAGQLLLRIGYAITDVNADGVADLVGSEPDYFPEHPSWISQPESTRSDLLRGYRNGRGLSVSLGYRSAIEQRDVALEQRAQAHAESPLSDGPDDPSGDDDLAEPIGPGSIGTNVHHAVAWSTDAVLATRTIATVDRAPATTHYRYAHPRRCQLHQTDLGFRLVEATRSDDSLVESFYFQDHGRTGRLAERTIRDEEGRPRRFFEERWEVVDPRSLTGGWRASAAGRFDRAFIGRRRTRIERNEYGDTAGQDPGFETRTDWVYDDTHGYNFVSAIHRLVPGQESLKVRAAAPVDLVSRLLRRPARESVYAIEPGGARPLSDSRFEYAGPAGEYTFDKVGLRRDSTMPRDGTGAFSERWIYYRYADNGNLIEERIQLEGRAGGAFRSTAYCYDGEVAAGCPAGQGSRSLRSGVRDALGGWTISEPHPVFGVPVRVASDYRDVPTLRSEYDDLGRVVTTRVELADESLLTLSESRFFDFPPAGVAHAGGFATYRVDRRFAEDGARHPESAIESITVDDGVGGTAMLVELLGPVGPGVAALDAVARDKNSDPSARQIRRSERFACGPVTTSDREDYASEDYAAILVACAAVPAVAKTVTREMRDALGRVIRMETPEGGVAIARYTSQDHPSAEGEPAVPHDLVFRKAANGGLSQLLMAAGRPTLIRECNAIELDPTLASLDGVDCEAPQVTRFAYEPTGELRERTDATVPLAGGTGPHRFGASDVQRLAYEYDRLGRIITIHDPDAGTTRLAYDALGRRVSAIDARGIEIRRAYDALGRPTRIEVDGEAPTEILYREDRLGRIRMIDGELEKHYSYDALGRLWREIRFVDGLSLIRETEWDLLGRPQKIRHPTVIDGVVDAIGYDYAGARLVAVCDLGLVDEGCDSPTATPIVSRIDYDALGRPTALQLPGGVRELAYDRSSRRRTRDVFDSDVGALEDIEYRYRMPGVAGAAEVPAYDVLGNLLRVEARIGTGSGDPAYVMEYAFDARNRIERWEYDADVFDYAYDARGNLTTRAGRDQGFESLETAHAIRWRTDAEGVLTHGYTYDAAGHLRSVSRPGVGTTHFAFDGRGRMTCVGRAEGVCDRLRVAYNGEDERVRETGSRTFVYAGPDFRLRPGAGGTQEYWIEIHALGQRIAYKHVSGGGVRIVGALPARPDGELRLRWAEGRAPPELAALLVLFSSLLLATIGCLVAGAGPVRTAVGFSVMGGLVLLPVRVWAGGAPSNPYRHGAAVYRWVMSDPIGSSLVELDASGQRLSYSAFAPFGGLAESAGSGGVVGRHYFGGHDRQLDLGLVYMNARWMDPETGTFLSVDPVVPTMLDPQSYNGYAYARNNPISLVDPRGTDWRLVFTDARNGDIVSRGSWQQGRIPGDLVAGVRALGGEIGSLAGDILDASRQRVGRSGAAAAGETTVARTTGSGGAPSLPETQRREILGIFARLMSREVAAGQRTSLEALAQIGAVAASFGTDGERFVDDLGATLSGTSIASPTAVAGRVPRFDASGFRSDFQDGSNQVRHFAGALVAGAALGFLGGQGANTIRELTALGSPAFSRADVLMGNAAARLGARLASGVIHPLRFAAIVRREF